jgi:hypothetical protein
MCSVFLWRLLKHEILITLYNINCYYSRTRARHVRTRARARTHTHTHTFICIYTLYGYMYNRCTRAVYIYYKVYDDWPINSDHDHWITISGSHYGRTRRPVRADINIYLSSPIRVHRYTRVRAYKRRDAYTRTRGFKRRRKQQPPATVITFLLYCYYVPTRFYGYEKM